MAPPPVTPRESPRDFIDQLLREQNQLLTPVEVFARRHAEGDIPEGKRYGHLLPVTPPVAGEQYAFEVDLDKCSGCKACVTACHSLNGLDDNETWRDVGLLVEAPKPRRNRFVGGTSSASPTISLRAEESGTRGTRPSTTTLQHVTTACHHCVDPACLNGCPVLAYDKDPITGIVRHLDDQCIGCQYCVLKCPYDVPKYNERLGIVRKCDMCANRLAVGEAPACAQACPSEAIRITKVQTEAVTIEFRQRAATFLPGSPEGGYTLPTTRYTSSRWRADDHARPHTHDSIRADVTVRAPQLVAADHAELKPQPAHWPLVFMLVLTQVSVGAVCAAVASSPAHSVPLLGIAVVFAALGLGASVFHLGRPLGAWRGFLNFKRSWMSREIVMFGNYTPLLAGSFLSQRIAFAAAMMGLAGVFCSAMIYADTRRELWRSRRSITLFLFTTVLLGASTALLLQPTNALLAALLVTAALAKLIAEISILRHVTQRSLTPLKKAALLITGTFQRLAFARLVCIVAAGIGLPVLLSADALPQPHWFAGLALALLLIGELMERCLFFRTVVAPKMPGGLTS